MERELLLTGIGGQGIQLAAEVLSRAVIAEGRDVQMFGIIDGLMRGGTTQAVVAIADGRITAPPTIPDTWSAILMHHDNSDVTIARFRPGTVVLVNSTVFEGSFDREPYLVVDVPATDIAVEVGNIIAASMVMLGAYAGVTQIASLSSLVDAVGASLPSYRAAHITLNTEALRAGYDAAPHALVSAWDEVTV